MIGSKFGKLTLLKQIKHDNNNHDTRYECKCDCGRIIVVRRYCLTRKRFTQCRSCARTIHGLHDSETYSIWQTMIQRVSNPNNTAFKYYGGRGISVCSRWLNFKNFLEDMGLRPERLELDRIDPNGDYTKNNCRWVTHKENMNNRRCSKNA